MPTTFSKIMIIAVTAAAAAAATAALIYFSGGTACALIGYGTLAGSATAIAGVIIDKITTGASSIFEVMVKQWQPAKMDEESIGKWIQRMVITLFKGRKYVEKKIEEGKSPTAAYEAVTTYIHDDIQANTRDTFGGHCTLRNRLPINNESNIHAQRTLSDIEVTQADFDTIDAVVAARYVNQEETQLEIQSLRSQLAERDQQSGWNGRMRNQVTQSSRFAIM